MALYTKRAYELAELAERARSGSVTLVFAARDERYNNAVVIRDAVQSLLAGPG